MQRDSGKPPRAPLGTELRLLRTCLRRVWSRMQQEEGAADDPRLMQTLMQLVRTIAAVERVRRTSRGSGAQDGGLAQRVLAGLDPHRDL